MLLGDSAWLLSGGVVIGPEPQGPFYWSALAEVEWKLLDGILGGLSWSDGCLQGFGKGDGPRGFVSFSDKASTLRSSA